MTTVPASGLPLPYKSGTSNWEREVDDESSLFTPKTPSKPAAIRAEGKSRHIRITKLEVSEGFIASTIRKPALQRQLIAKSKFEKIDEDLAKGAYTYKQRTVSFFAQGSYFSVYNIGTDQKLVFKALHGKKIGLSETRLTPLLKHVLESYRCVKKTGLLVAEILNSKTALKDGFLVQKKISSRVDVRNQEQMTQVSNFFSVSVAKNLLMDLQPENLRVDEQGKVHLIDFVEDSSEDVHILITMACRSWIEECQKSKLLPAEGRALLESITESFIKQKDYSTTWLSELLASR